MLKKQILSGVGLDFIKKIIEWVFFVSFQYSKKTVLFCFSLKEEILRMDLRTRVGFNTPFDPKWVKSAFGFSEYNIFNFYC